MTFQFPPHTFEERKKIYDLIMECELRMNPGYELPIDTLNAPDLELNSILGECIERSIAWNQDHKFFGTAEHIFHRYRHVLQGWYERVRRING